MITPAALMISKSLVDMVIISGNSCIFVPPSRGSGQRRGATRERLEVDLGR